MAVDGQNLAQAWFYYSTTTWLRTWPCATCLINECQVETPICQSLKCAQPTDYWGKIKEEEAYIWTCVKESILKEKESCQLRKSY